MNDHQEENCPAGWSGVTVPDEPSAPPGAQPAKDRDNRKRDSELLATERICRIVEDDVPEDGRERVLLYLLRRYIGPGQCSAPPAERQAPRNFLEALLNPPKP